MTKETLKKAIELERAIENNENWMKRLKEANAVVREKKDSGHFSLRIRTESGIEGLYPIPANAALKAIENAHAEILKE